VADLFDARARALLWNALTTPLDPDDLRRDDEELIERIAPLIDLLCRVWFRQDVEGLENIPAGPSLVVVNHEAGITFVQILGFGARWVLSRGAAERILPLMHDAMFGVPLLGNMLCHLGAVRASHRNAEAVFEQGRKVLVAPGGNLEAFRPWSERFRIKLGGRKGWARLALRAGVPVCPVVFCGGQESLVVLWDGQPLVRALGLRRWLRVDTFPVFLGLPWGIAFGPWLHLPLPAKCSTRVLPPIEPRGDPDDESAVDALYDEVTAAMQAAMDDLAARRVLPILG
jgi:1-acyl-sn-glycerol-3-phosphate acyltransferase